MRLRNVKNKETILDSCTFLIREEDAIKKIGNWEKEFANSNPIEVEIGMGKGKFIYEKAKLNPGINYIGIEKYDSIVAKAIEKMGPGLNNLKIVRMDALNINKVFSNEVSMIYLNFSDPWPKSRHSNRRLTSKMFLEKYDSIFRGTKTICQKTDNRNLFEYSIVSLSENGYVIKEISLDLHSDLKEEDIVSTEYEVKFTSKGNKIYYLKSEK